MPTLGGEWYCVKVVGQVSGLTKMSVWVGSC